MELPRRVGGHEFIEAVTEPASEVADVESPLSTGGRWFAVQMKRNFTLYEMFSRGDKVLSGFDRLSAARTDEYRSLVHQTFILTNGRVLAEPPGGPPSDESR
jgi:hypothetical protein